MNKNLKKILVTGASLLMFASVSVGINGVHAAHVSLGGGVGPVQSILTSTNQTNAYRGTFRQHGYTFNERHGVPANVIVGIDGDKRVSNHQVMRALKGHHVNLSKRHHKRHSHKHIRKHYRKVRKHARRHLRRHTYKR